MGGWFRSRREKRGNTLREFCRSYAEAIEQVVASPTFSFVEVFSGPNAPLSKEVALVADEQLQDAPEDTGPSGASKVEHSRLPESAAPVEVKEVACPPCAERDQYTMAALGAAKQPSYGKRIQLIPDGLRDPRLHLDKAKLLAHPFEAEHGIKEDHQRAISVLVEQGPTVIKQRLEALEKLRRRSQSLREQQARENERASWTAKKLGLKIQTALMRELQTRYSIEDTRVPEICLKGAGIIEPADKSAFFDPFEVVPSVSVQEYHATKLVRSRRQGGVYGYKE